MGDLGPAPSAEELLGRDDWACRIGPFEALGQRYEVWTDDEALAGFLAILYAPMVSVDGAEAAVYRVVAPTVTRKGTVLRDGRVMGERRSRAGVLQLLQWAINRQVIDRSCLDRVLLHAGAVARDGTAVVLPAAMEAGKTTLTTGLLDRGFDYLTDEAAAVAPDLTVTGYAKPLSIDPGSWEVLDHHRPQVDAVLEGYLDRQWHVPVIPIAGVVASARLGVVVMPRYQAGAPPELERLSPSAALIELAHCTFVPDDVPMPTDHVRRLAGIIAEVPVYRMVSSDLAGACDVVSRVLDASSAAAST